MEGHAASRRKLPCQIRIALPKLEVLWTVVEDDIAGRDCDNLHSRFVLALSRMPSQFLEAPDGLKCSRSMIYGILRLLPGKLQLREVGAC